MSITFQLLQQWLVRTGRVEFIGQIRTGAVIWRKTCGFVAEDSGGCLKRAILLANGFCTD